MSLHIADTDERQAHRRSHPHRVLVPERHRRPDQEANRAQTGRHPEEDQPSAPGHPTAPDGTEAEGEGGRAQTEIGEASGRVGHEAMLLDIEPTAAIPYPVPEEHR